MTLPVVIRPPTESDCGEFVRAARRSAGLHGVWTTAPSTAEEFSRYLKASEDPANAFFLVFRRNDGILAGVVSVSNIVRGAFRSGYLGYYAFAGSEGQGNMKAGLRLVIRHAFDELKLHRLEANIQPDNEASIALVRSCGFLREGYSPRYLKIRGRWRDHERWAIISS